MTRNGSLVDCQHGDKVHKTQILRVFYRYAAGKKTNYPNATFQKLLHANTTSVLFFTFLTTVVSEVVNRKRKKK